jgi:hypothetical protein
MKPKDAQRPDRHTTVFQITPPRAFRYDTLVIAVGSVTNDFGTPGASQYAVPLETPVQAMRFNRHLVNADESPTVIDGIRPRKSGSQLTPRWRSESRANPSLKLVLIPGRLWVIPDRKSDVSCLG